MLRRSAEIVHRACAPLTLSRLVLELETRSGQEHLIH
jgi:hypothetical protein